MDYQFVGLIKLPHLVNLLSQPLAYLHMIAVSTNNSVNNVLVVVRWPVGGIRTYLTYIYSNEIFNDFKFTIITPDYEESRILKKELNSINIEFIFLKTEGVMQGILTKVIKALQSRKYSLVHSHGYTSGIAVSHATWLFGVPHLLSVHDVLLDTQFKGIKGSLKKKILGICVKHVDTIHSVTGDAQKNLVEYIPSLVNTNKKMVIISNGVDLKKFENAIARDFRKELKISNNTTIAGFFGRFMGQKGFDTIIKAIEILSIEGVSEEDLVVVATNTGGFVREDFKRIHEMKLDKYFRLVEFEPNIGSALKGIDMLLMPSRWEAAGILAMEAMCVGTTVIGSKCIGLREVLTNTPSLQIEPENESALADGIKIMLNAGNRNIAKEYTNEAKKRFTIERTVENMHDLYLDMVR